jgi:hypothetical protein
MRKKALLVLALIVCAAVGLSCTASPSTEDKAQAASPQEVQPPGISGALITQTFVAEASASPKSTYQQSDSTVAPTRDEDNRQKAGVATSVSDPSRKAPAPPQRLRIVVIKD